MEVKLAGWTTYKEGMPSIDSFASTPEDRQKLSWECEHTVADDVIKNKWRFSGEHHQYGKCGMPVLSVDGKAGIWMCSWRGWGAFMADCWNDIERADKYDYMDFYMGGGDEASFCQDEFHFPQEETKPNEDEN